MVLRQLIDSQIHAYWIKLDWFHYDIWWFRSAGQLRSLNTLMQNCYGNWVFFSQVFHYENGICHIRIAFTSCWLEDDPNVMQGLWSIGEINKVIFVIVFLLFKSVMKTLVYWCQNGI